MSSSIFDTSSMVKSATGAGLAFAFDKFWFQERNFTNSAYFAGSVGLGLAVGGAVGAMAPDYDLGSFGSSKAIESRISEIIFGTGTAYLVNKFALKNDYSRNQLLEKLAVIAICDVVGELVSDAVAGREINPFK